MNDMTYQTNYFYTQLDNCLKLSEIEFWNFLIELCLFPDKYKIGKLKFMKIKPESWEPVSLLLVIAKSIEKAIPWQVLQNTSRKIDLLYKYQSSFRKINKRLLPYKVDRFH